MASNGNGNGNGHGAGSSASGDDDLPQLIPGWVPGPGWQRREQPRPARRATDRRRLRNGLLVAAALLTALAFLAAFSSSVSSITPTIGDDAFARSANALCLPVAERLADAGAPEREPSDAERAEAIEARVAALTEMVDAVARLEPAAADEAKVEAWLDDWRAVLRSGRDTAAARRAGDDDAAAAASRAGQSPAARVDAFAVANAMGACAARLR
jgi:hypothetical protein